MHALIAVSLLVSFVTTSAAAQDALADASTGPPLVVIDTVPSGEVAIAAPNGSSQVKAGMGLRIRRARIGFWATLGVAAAGLTLIVVGGFAYPHCSDEFACADEAQWQSAVLWSGGAMLVSGGLGMLASGIIMAKRKKQKRRYEHTVANHGHRRLQFDVEGSPVVF